MNQSSLCLGATISLTERVASIIDSLDFGDDISLHESYTGKAATHEIISWVSRESAAMVSSSTSVKSSKRSSIVGGDEAERSEANWW